MKTPITFVNKCRSSKKMQTREEDSSFWLRKINISEPLLEEGGVSKRGVTVSRNVTGYQGLFCLLNRCSCDRLPGCVQVVKAGGPWVFVVEISYFYMKNRGNF